MSQVEQMANKPDRFTVKQLIERQIDQTYDRIRMRQAWERVFASGDPAELAEGMCMALSHGGFTREQKPMQITLNISGNVDAQALADSLKAFSEVAVTGHA
ncbi:hypothetical protein [Pseudomonas asiatica]|uniref:Uncharacterized protein n=1 Tax=Pseudomonas asiatica TaxID=2219225 RepID=A0ABU5L467_9PSED|nr:hypothetical protein [Pseudomonas asiatica]MDZ5740962.1 hypothetical protein [Pseudomonas asiatica]MDZ5746283.1 hypothetical protein [Pseudomonas asiatica]MDZ5751272.1 hypothetical protein [Pseudomonas asiatica]MDZ5756260.1 hypothetical protein [Pseudomonas asiatica]